MPAEAPLSPHFSKKAALLPEGVVRGSHASAVFAPLPLPEAGWGRSPLFLTELSPSLLPCGMDSGAG